MGFSHFRSLLYVLPLALSALAQLEVPNTIYFISNAETPSLDRPGLSPVGRYRAYECLPPVSIPCRTYPRGAESLHEQLAASVNIGLIISCAYDAESGLCASTIATATPIATKLGLPINTSW